MQIGSDLSLVDAKAQFSPHAVQLTDAEKKADFFERLMAGEVDIEEFPEIDMNFLRSARNFEGMLVPCFSMFDVTSAFGTDASNESLTCEAHASCEKHGRGGYESRYGVTIGGGEIQMDWVTHLWGEIFTKSLVVRALAMRLKDKRDDRVVSVTISEAFSPTAIPKRIKGLVSREMELFENVLLVKEANWRLNVRNESMPKPARLTNDPLIIGRKKDKFFLLHSFDTTKIEHYVSKEFTKSPKEGGR